MRTNNEIKVTLPQLLSLFTGGRPVGLRNYGDQYQDFFTYFSFFSYLDLNKFSGRQKEQADQLNFKNMLECIDLQYPELKKSVEFRKLCSEYVKKVPNLYDNVDNDMYLKDNEYQILTKRLMKKAREILGSQKRFVVKNLKAFAR